MKIPKLFKKFDEDISFKNLFVKWLIFLGIGLALMFALDFIFSLIFEVGVPDPSKSDEVFCALPNLIWLNLAFLLETIVFMILPWKWKGKKGLIVGLSLWAFLHLLGGTNFITALPYFLYISIKAVFYYRCLEINKVWQIFFFHFLINVPAILSCLI